jgi:hypothetical protein
MDPNDTTDLFSFGGPAFSICPVACCMTLKGISFTSL